MTVHIDALAGPGMTTQPDNPRETFVSEMAVGGPPTKRVTRPAMTTGLGFKDSKYMSCAATVMTGNRSMHAFRSVQALREALS